jgi:hypothetical protein
MLRQMILKYDHDDNVLTKMSNVCTRRIGSYDYSVWLLYENLIKIMESNWIKLLFLKMIAYEVDRYFIECNAFSKADW